MKKILVLAVVGIMTLTGCDATAMDTLTCTYQTSTNNLTTNTKYAIDYQDNEVKKVRITYDYMQDTNNSNNGTNDANNTDNGARIYDDINDVNNNNDMNSRTTNGTNSNNDDNVRDGIGTGTDGTTNDTQIDDDGIVDGIVGSAIDSIINGVTSTILDVSGLRDRHTTVQNTYNNINGFSVQNTVDTDNNYKVTYVIDYDTISDNDLNSLNLSRDLDALRRTYVSQGFTCK